MGTELISFVLLVVNLGQASGNSTATATPDSGTSDISKAFISLGVLGAAFLISFLVAKVVDHCYDRAALRDDASDISEHTRQLIRARIALSRFKTPLKKKKKHKKKSPKEAKKNTKVFFNIWSKNAKKMVTKRKKSEIVINVEEAKGVELLQVNGGVKKMNPHVTFVDEVHKSDKGKQGAVISITVPKLKTTPASNETKESPKTPPLSSREPTKTNGNAKISTISAKVAERENSAKGATKVNLGKDSNAKDTPGKITHVKAQPAPTPKKTTLSNNGGTTPSRDTKTTTATGRATPTQSRPVSTTGVGSPTPRSSSTSPSKTVSVSLTSSPSRPKTAPARKTGNKVVSVKATVTKSPSTPKLNIKSNQQGPKSKSS